MLNQLLESLLLCSTLLSLLRLYLSSDHLFKVSQSLLIGSSKETTVPYSAEDFKLVKKENIVIYLNTQRDGTIRSHGSRQTARHDMCCETSLTTT